MHVAAAGAGDEPSLLAPATEMIARPGGPEVAADETTMGEPVAIRGDQFDPHRLDHPDQPGHIVRRVLGCGQHLGDGGGNGGSGHGGARRCGDASGGVKVLSQCVQLLPASAGAHAMVHEQLGEQPGSLGCRPGEHLPASPPAALRSRASVAAAPRARSGTGRSTGTRSPGPRPPGRRPARRRNGAERWPRTPTARAKVRIVSSCSSDTCASCHVPVPPRRRAGHGDYSPFLSSRPRHRLLTRAALQRARGRTGGRA